MDAEMKSLVITIHGQLIERPPDANVIGSKWVYTIKYNADAVSTNTKHV